MMMVMISLDTSIPLDNYFNLLAFSFSFPKNARKAALDMLLSGLEDLFASPTVLMSA